MMREHIDAAGLELMTGTRPLISSMAFGGYHEEESFKFDYARSQLAREGVKLDNCGHANSL